MKLCPSCGETKLFSAYYRHPKTSDGYLNKCKTCHKAAVNANRAEKADYYRAFDRSRGNRQSLEDLQKYRADNPKKYVAHCAVNNAVRDGRLTKAACEVCGKVETVNAHHDDYDTPLIVRWLCSVHHKAWHKLHGEGANAH